MSVLDIRTIMAGYVLTNLACLLAMYLFWRQSRGRMAGSGFWLADYALQSIAVLLIVFRGALPDGLSITLPHGMILTGAWLGYLGLLRFIGRPAAQAHNVVMIAFLTAVHGYFTFSSPDASLRTAVSSAGLLWICAQCAWLLLCKASPVARKAVTPVGIVFILYCVVAAARILEYVAFRPFRADYFQPAASDVLALFAYHILLIVLTYALMLMFNQRLAENLKTEEEKFSKAFYSSPYAAAITRLADGWILDVNDSFLALSGYKKEDLQGKTTVDLNLWRQAEDRADVLSDLSQSKPVRNREYGFRKKNGEILTCLYSAEQIVINEDLCLLSSLHDVSDRKKMETELQKSEQMLRMVMDNLPIGIAVNSVDPAVEFQYINDHFTAFYRTTREEILKVGGFWEAVYEDPQVREEMKARVLADCASGDPGRMIWEEVPITRNGQEIAYISARNIPIPGGNLMMSTVWDVTEQVKSKKEIQRLNEVLSRKVDKRTRELRDSQLALLNLVDDLNETSRNLASANMALEAANKELEAFSYSVSHDLRAPLRAIDGFSQALLEDYGESLPEEGQTYLSRIRKATQHMGQLIDDLLKLSRVSRAEFNRTNIDLSQMAYDILERARVLQPHRAVELRIQPNLAASGDRRLVEIALENLLGNAWKFTSKTEHARIEFGAAVIDGKDVFFVRDNGAGFDMKYVDKLFGPFQRLHKAEDFEGTGIGLATVKRVVTRHGGDIWAEGNIGQGATFYFTLSS